MKHLLFLMGWSVLGFGVWGAIKVYMKGCGDWGLDCAWYSILILAATMAVSAVVFWGATARLGVGSYMRPLTLSMAWLTTIVASIAVVGVMAVLFIVSAH